MPHTGHLSGISNCFFFGAVLHDFQHVRNHFAGALDEHRIAGVNIERSTSSILWSVDFDNGDAADLHRLENRERSEHAGAPDADQRFRLGEWFPDARDTYRRSAQRGAFEVKPSSFCSEISSTLTTMPSISYGSFSRLRSHAIDVVLDFLKRMRKLSSRRSP